METGKVVLEGDSQGPVSVSLLRSSRPHYIHLDPPLHREHLAYWRIQDSGNSMGRCHWPRLTLKGVYLSLIVVVLFVILTYSSNDYHTSFMPGPGISSAMTSDHLKDIVKAILQQHPEGSVAGWSYNTSRDTRQYVQPGNVTPLHRPKDICTSQPSPETFLLVVICSSMDNFHARMAIRETWGNITNYEILANKYKNVTKYSNNLTSTDISDYSNFSMDASRMKRNLPDYDEEDEGVRRHKRNAVSFDDSKEGDAQADDPRFQRDREEVKSTEKEILGNFEGTEVETIDNNIFDYDYQTEISNIMRIPARGEIRTSAENEELNSIKNMLRLSIKDNKLHLTSNEVAPIVPKSDSGLTGQTKTSKIKFVFLLGQAAPDFNDTSLQLKIDNEAALYGDILQESFVDSYNNLTLKSVMLLKWFVNDCAETVKYVMKTDDDMFINLPRLINSLEEKEKSIKTKTDNLLMGALICQARPISDTRSKWYSPRYMFGGKVYPKYLSGTGYVMSNYVAAALYKAALDTPLFHLEDVYITGMCSHRVGIRPIDNSGFSYTPRTWDICSYYKAITGHQVSPMKLRRVYSALVYSPLPLLSHCDKKNVTTYGKKKKIKKPICT